MRFNETTKKVDEVVNYEGEKAYKLDHELDLYSTVVTSSLTKKFYESEDDRVARIRNLIEKNNPEFVAKLAIYTREKMYLRSMPLVLAVELAKIHSGDNLVSKTVERVIQRADEITELLAYYQVGNERTKTKKLNKLSKQIQIGVASALNKFSEYQFAKYNRKAQVTLKDAIFLSHPKAKDDQQQALFDKIVNDKLEVPYTWEVELSRLGQQKFETEEEKKKVFKGKWEEIIDSGKLGYMAMLRNLRNFLESNVDVSVMSKVCQELASPEKVRKSKQFPFRFLSAYQQIKEVASGSSSMILNALEEAVKVSIENVKGFDYNTAVVIACDVSGSMQETISEKSVVQNYDIGLMLGMLLQHKCKNIISGFFGETWKIVNLPQSNILANVDELHRREGEVGYSTNGYLVIRDLRKRNIIADKIMIFTDCQMWDSNEEDGGHIAEEWASYKEIAPKAKLYLFDLAGYGNTPISTRKGDVYLIAGWSEKVFEILEAIENGSSAVEEIKKIKVA